MARQKVADLAATQHWVIEGVYGWLAEVAVPRATALMWLDVSWDVCREGLLARGLRCGGTEADFVELLSGQKLTGIARRDILERSSIDNYPLEPSST